MNVVERQSQVTRELYEINVETMKRLVGLSGEGMKRYLNLNAEYLHEMVERPEPGRFLELQRRYGESLIAGLRDDAQAGGRILSQALARTSSTLIGAWSGTGDDVRRQSVQATAAVADAAENVASVVERAAEVADPAAGAEEAAEAARSEAARGFRAATPAAVEEVLERVAEPLKTSELPDRPVELLEPAAEFDDTSAPAADAGATAAEEAQDQQPVSDRLERVTGIGRAMASQLRDAGVETLSQLADLDVEALADEDHPLHHLRPRIEAEHWIGQARELLDMPRH